MTTINAMQSNQARIASETEQATESLADKAAASVSDLNIGYMMMYEQWKTDILLSNGLNEDDTAEW